MSDGLGWLLKHPDAVNAFSMVVNFWAAAWNFEQGGWWWILTALHISTMLIVAHYWLKLNQMRKEYEREQAELQRLIDSINKKLYGRPIRRMEG